MSIDTNEINTEEVVAALLYLQNVFLLLPLTDLQLESAQIM